MSPCCVNGVLRTVATLAAKKQAEVWGSPIAHSLSPTLHTTAYELMGLDAQYRATEVDAASLAAELGRVDSSFLGVSLTMPLKEPILPLVPEHRGLVDELGAANTLVVGDQGFTLWNTDPAGVMGALGDAGMTDLSRVLILGAGATARSVVAALAQLGSDEVILASRQASRASQALDVAAQRGLKASWISLEGVMSLGGVSLVVNTTPGGVDVSGLVSDQLVAQAALFDVAYSPWPSAAATRWESSTRPVVSGLSMLVHQAVIQIRLFTTGDPGSALPGEPEILAAMKASVGLPSV